MGSIRALTDSAGSVSGTATYDAYGVVLTTTGTTTPCGYAGQYTDAESGLQYLRARYYDPATAQFLTVDPLLAQTDQAYAYADGSPTNKTDPSGLARKTDTTEAGGYGDEFWWYYVHHGTYPDAGLGAISWIWDGATGLAKFYQNWWSTAIQDPGYLIGLMGQSGLPIEVVDPKVDYLCSEFSGKAKGFESLGFTEANKGDLKALLEAIGTSVNRSRAVEVTNYGTKFDKWWRLLDLMALRD